MKYEGTNNHLSRRTFSFAIIIAIAIGMACPTAAQRLSSHNKLNRLAQQQGNNDAASLMFKGGRDLVGDEQWAKAEEKFNQYISAYPKEKNVDAAMYWKAYSEYKLKKFDQCKGTIDRLLKTYEKTTWKEDAQMLLAQLPNATVTVKVDPITVTVDPAEVAVQAQEIPQERIREAQERAQEAQERAQERVREAQERMQARLKEAQERIKDSNGWPGMGKGLGIGIGSGEGTSDDDPCEFKIVVLQALFESDVQRGIAAATDWLKPGSTQTVRCKGAALTLLARHGGKSVTPVILGVAQNETDLKLRSKAISVLGATNDDSVLDPLRNFALSTQDDIAEAALYALSQHTSPRAITMLSEIAISSKQPGLRKAAISAIASRQGEPAVDALLKIYDADQSLEIRKAVISGLSRRRSERAASKLLEIARGADNMEIRKSAISGIGRRGGEPAIDALLGLYDSEKNEELKDQIINSLGYSNDQRVIRKLIEIARNPQTPIERRKRAIGWLSRSKDPEVLKFLEDLLK